MIPLAPGLVAPREVSRPAPVLHFLGLPVARLHLVGESQGPDGVECLVAEVRWTWWGRVVRAVDRALGVSE